MRQKIYFEILWWVITVVIVLLVLSPIYLNIKNDYPFYTYNIICIVIAVTFMRYIFMLKHHYIVYAKWIKVIFIFIPIPLLLVLTDAISTFQAFVDEEGIYSIMKGMPNGLQKGLSSYIRSEMLFFWAAAMLSNLLLPVRMIVSLWREINKGTH
ncbi:MAG: hypothetical protein HKN09_08480 [Saprospiraceae bacterium]|nr:hypothetical protein [Saprospiraceae bacterium]